MPGWPDLHPTIAHPTASVSIGRSWSVIVHDFGGVRRLRSWQRSFANQPVSLGQTLALKLLEYDIHKGERLEINLWVAVIVVETDARDDHSARDDLVGQ